MFNTFRCNLKHRWRFCKEMKCIGVTKPCSNGRGTWSVKVNWFNKSKYKPGAPNPTAYCYTYGGEYSKSEYDIWATYYLFRWIQWRHNMKYRRYYK